MTISGVLLDSKGSVIPTENVARQRMILPYMLSLVIASLEAGGTVVREDVKTLIGKVSAVGLKGLPQAKLQSTAKRVELEGYDILQKAAVGDLETLFAAIGCLIVYLQSEGHEINQDAAMIGLLIAHDFGEDPGQFGGQQPVSEAQNKVFNELRELGYFSKNLLQITQG